jgi:hypothetical protein
MHQLLLTAKAIVLWMVTLGVYALLSVLMGDSNDYYNTIPPHFILMVILAFLYATVMGMIIFHHDRTISNNSEMRRK